MRVTKSLGKPGHALLDTTNLAPGSLTDRFHTRFQTIRLQLLENEVLATFLLGRWAVPIGTPRMIAAGAAGNVRAVMADSEMCLGAVSRKPHRWMAIAITSSTSE